MKITSTSKVVDAVMAQDGITDRHLPIYIRDYLVAVVSPIDKAQVLWSTVGFLPSHTERKRILGLQCAISILEPLGPTQSTLADMTIQFDFSDIRAYLRDNFEIFIEGPIEGSISFDVLPQTLNANAYTSYDYDLGNAGLTLYIKNMTFPIPTFPMTMFLDIAIRDDVDDPNYPRFFPIQIANNILRMPPLGLSNGGEGVTVVTLLLFCCPEELKTLQISTLNIASPNAFNPTFDITQLLLQQGVPIPSGGFQFQFRPARPFAPVPDSVEPVDWTKSPSMTNTSYDMQNLYTSAPQVNIIILYDDYTTTNIESPAFWTWLSDNVDIYDIALLPVSIVKNTPWTTTAFETTFNNFLDTMSTPFFRQKPVLTICDENGSQDPLQFPFGTHNFSACFFYTLTLGGFQLTKSNSYALQGPYTADPNSGGGYCSGGTEPMYPFQQEKFSFQTEYVVGSIYGRPDVSGYSRDLLFSLNGSPVASYGIGFSLQPFAALIAKIYVNSNNRKWNFTDILYKKGNTICKSIIRGRNDNFECGRFEHCAWNPVTGFGLPRFDYLYRMCDVLRNNTYIQISAYRGEQNPIPNPLSFLNLIPPNPFANVPINQPVFGFSSIFSFFKLYTIDSVPSTQPIAQTPIVHDAVVYLLDVTETLALSYGLDDGGRLYLFVQNVNYGSQAQQWRVSSIVNPQVGSPIYAFDIVEIVPRNFPNLRMSKFWNANGSSKPSCPSFASVGAGGTWFSLSTDPAVDVYIDEIRNQRLNDQVWSYYVNFTDYTQESNLLFLRNSNEVSLSGSEEAIRNARNGAQTFNRTPRWGNFDPYPEWVLIPLNVDYDPMMYIGDVEDVNSRTGQYMIFNVVTQSYLFFGFGKILEKPISLDTFQSDPLYSFHINQFVFNLNANVDPDTNAKVNVEELFSPTVKPKPGLPDDVPFEPCQRSDVVITHIETNPDGYFQRCAWTTPVGSGEGEELRDNLYSVDDPQQPFLFTLYWVNKRYIVVNQNEYLRIIAYNGTEDDDQDNSGLAISSNPGANNLNNNAPSFASATGVSNDTLWALTNNAKVRDSTTTNEYIWCNENIRQPSETNLRFISVNDAQNRAIGVNGPNVPQPTLVDRTVPIQTEWSITTTLFPQPPNQRRRSNYLYKGVVYSFYSFSEEPTAGFLSSLFDVFGGSGWEPSMIEGFTSDEFVYVGDPHNCFFVLG